MHISLRAVVLAAASLSPGCDWSPPPPPPQVVKGPHHGTTIRLPEDKGFVELTNEPEVRDRRSREPTALVAYFLRSDARSALDPAPTDVSFEVQAGTRRSRIVPLSAKPSPDDLAGTSRFVSKPGPYQLSNIRGKLIAKIDGQSVSTVFEGSR
jgi:hypothetical protein